MDEVIEGIRDKAEAGRRAGAKKAAATRRKRA
jgi:hypothetical protein